MARSDFRPGHVGNVADDVAACDIDFLPPLSVGPEFSRPLHRRCTEAKNRLIGPVGTKKAFRNSLLRKALLSRGDKIRTCDLLNPIQTR